MLRKPTSWRDRADDLPDLLKPKDVPIHLRSEDVEEISRAGAMEQTIHLISLSSKMYLHLTQILM
jgi:hypothetical protein